MRRKTHLAALMISVSTILVLAIPSAQADVHVFDANDQYLGVLTDGGGQGFFTVLIPKLVTMIKISTESGEVADVYGPLFESNDCSGTPYFRGNRMYWIQKMDDKYFIGENFPPVVRSLSSWLQNGTCDPDYDHEIPVVPMIEVEEESIPFSVPVALPLRFELRSAERDTEVVPGMTNWGMGIMVIFLAVSALLAIRRRLVG